MCNESACFLCWVSSVGRLLLGFSMVSLCLMNLIVLSVPYLLLHILPLNNVSVVVRLR